MDQRERERRHIRAPAAPPKSRSIGGAGTSVGGPPVVELPPDELLVELPVEPPLDELDELELDELLVEELVDEPEDDDVLEPPVEVLVELPPEEELVLDPPPDVEVEPPLVLLDVLIIQPPPDDPPPEKKPPPPKNPPEDPLVLPVTAAG